ncbi:MAG: hypothetical protein N3G20_04950, partial [Verrucomicrobiae bacterium]|nr:hypothetical protein [Verrucomicrobiae bacterium]
YPPYTDRVRDTNLVTDHVVTLDNLSAHTPYHWRIQSTAPGRRPAVTRDMIVCTRPDRANLLMNPGFEEGSEPSPRSTVPGWTKSGNLDMRLSDGSWFWGLPPRAGNWLFEGAINGSSSEGYLFQRVRVTPGKDYTFSAWVTTWMRENDTWKYDVWNDRNRLIHMRLGIDPTGSVNPLGSSVRWTPRVYSHLHYSNFSITATAASEYMTVFVAMQGQGGQWHLYGVDDCVLTETPPVRPRIIDPRFDPDGVFGFLVVSTPGKTNEIQACSDFDRWYQVANLANITGQIRFRDLQGTGEATRFYRVIVR